ncbi:DUF3800 domain-containing protein [Mycolicibacterium lutetiense]|uniref:DUF3800 domain-containing protein n=1 Tax=Mycolicibacterium lutetiense TaxID=1641992 RepID=A0ABS4ZZX4_9MYCO|nr:DUF3800 domain-containing protein [Mycolicibacterium lutetiense]MBP2454149.1 hypothetical protein [Mycolicibacterium lutetiense]
MNSGESVEIACDESGSDGENLVAGTSRVFAHGSTDLSLDEASRLIASLQSDIRFGGSELKSQRLLKGKHIGRTLRLFEPGGALHGRVKVSITDKAYMAVCKVVDLVIEEDAYRKGVQLHESGAARQMARDLFAEGPRAYGMETWNNLLGEFVSFVRSTQRKGAKTTLEQLLKTIDDLRLVSRRKRVETAMQWLWEGRTELEAYAITEGSRHDEGLRMLDPLIPALMQTARVWHEATGAAIVLVHDRQSVLTDEACSLLIRAGNSPHPDFPIRVPIEAIVLADSRDDPRIQIADIVAGVGTMAGRAVLDGELEDRVRQAIQPSLIDSSLWGDSESWRQLFN